MCLNRTQKCKQSIKTYPESTNNQNIHKTAQTYSCFGCNWTVEYLFYLLFPETTATFPIIIQQFLKGDFEEILKSSDCAVQLLGAENASKSKDLCVFIKTNVQAFIQENEAEDRSVTVTNKISCIQVLVN